MLASRAWTRTWCNFDQKDKSAVDLHSADDEEWNKSIGYQLLKFDVGSPPPSATLLPATYVVCIIEHLLQGVCGDN